MLKERFPGLVNPPRKTVTLPAVPVTISRRTLNTDVSSTVLVHNPPGGLYRVEVVMFTTTNDALAGTLSFDLAWTDLVGSTTGTPIAAHVLTATGRSTGSTLLHIASGDITYSTTVTGIYSNAVYALEIRVVRLG